MKSCGHIFAWHAVIPPSHCPRCGACLACGSPRPIPVMPYPTPYYPPPRPWWQQGPYYSTAGDSTYSRPSTISINAAA